MSWVETVTIITYSTPVLITSTIIKAWSWKWISSSIMGEAASWKPSWAGWAM